mgnify:CR=1 FL=1
MIYSDTLSLAAPESGACAALGNFDGLHIGHRAVIGAAAASGFFSVVVTFCRNPRGVLGAPPPTPLTRSLKMRELGRLGADAVVELDFGEIRDLSPDEFAGLLFKNLRARQVVCGYNYHFGRGGAGDAGALKALAAKHGASCAVIPPVTLGGEEVSSTAIRGLIIGGQLEKANAMLGRAFAYDFPVVRGDGRGRGFGFPTANQVFPRDFVLPKFGVYASKTVIGGKIHTSVTNVGTRPTYRTASPLSETHIHDFSGDLYGQNVEVMLLSYLRGERLFENTDALRAQLAADSARSRIMG